MPRAARLLLASALGTALAACGSPAGTGAGAPLRLGVLLPLSGPLAAGGQEDLRALRIARDMANSSGGVSGRSVDLDVRDVHDQGDIAGAVASLHHDGVPVVIGTFASDLSIVAAREVDAAGMVYWETGAVADRVTGPGLPLVFRVGATGSNLGDNSARFLVEQLAPRLHRSPDTLSVSVVLADDDYAHSVAGAVEKRAAASGVRIASVSTYSPYRPDFSQAVRDIAAAHPDILVLASHIPDGIAFRRAFLAAHLHVDAFIGSTMAQCLPDFGDALGPDAVGVFASDRPGKGFYADLLPEATRPVFTRFASAWAAAGGGEPDEEGISAFTSGWALFHDVLPAARGVDVAAIAAAARTVDLPEGSLPNGAGLHFATSGALLGQNLRAAAVIWQWQAVRYSVVVWPPEYAWGSPIMVPLPR